MGVTLNGTLIDNLIRHDVTFEIPDEPGIDFFYHQMEALTGYMPPSFSKFRTWNPATNQLNVITAPNVEQNLPLIISTQDDQFAMGIFSFDLPQTTFPGGGYGASFFPGANSDAGPGTGVTKWNVVYREGKANQPGNLQTQSSLSYTNYLAVGTVQNVQNAFAQLVEFGNPEPPLRSLAITDFGFEAGGSVASPLGQGSHASWIVDSCLPGNNGCQVAPVGHPLAQGIIPPEGNVAAFTRSQPKSAADPDGTPIIIRNITEHLAQPETYTLQVDATTLNLAAGNGYTLELGYQNGGSSAAIDFVSLASLDRAWSGTPGVFQEITLEKQLLPDDPAIGFPLAIRWTNKAQAIGAGANSAYLDNVRLFTTNSFAASDFNHDGTVDGQDLVIWQNTFGVNNSGDANRDGQTDGADFLQWQREFEGNFQTIELIASAISVPEPATVLLLCSSIFLALHWR